MPDPTSRSRSFGAAAAAYARYRPGYPDAVADLVLEGLDPAASRALEIGAGTGQATRLLAGRGVHVTAVEPDPRMRALLQREVAGLPVTVVDGTLELLPPEVATHPVDLLYAAAAWHWTDPATRWERAARLVREGGVFAAFGGPLDLADPALHDAVSLIRLDVMQTDGLPEAWVRTSTDGLAWPGSDLVASPFFTAVREHDLTTTSVMATDDFVGLLSTIPAYLVLPQASRTAVLRRIRAALPDAIEVRRDLVVHRAVRTGEPVAAR